MSEAHDADVIVVGSGFGGAVAALRFAEAGQKVLVLERGPWVSRETHEVDLDSLWNPDKHRFGMNELRPRGDNIVPWVGACIHTPPPPPNQIVHVSNPQGYEVDGGLYTPVWVSGLMRTEQTRANLEYVDGSSDVPSAYRMDAQTVEPYE